MEQIRNGISIKLSLSNISRQIGNNSRRRLRLRGAWLEPSHHVRITATAALTLVFVWPSAHRKHRL